MNVMTGLVNNLMDIDLHPGVDESGEISFASGLTEELTEIGGTDPVTDSFVMMMAQVLNQSNQSNTPLETATETATETTTPGFSDENVIIASDVTPTGPGLNLNADETTAFSYEDALLEMDNVALSWIDSESYEPPSMNMRKDEVGQPLPNFAMTSTDNSDSTTTEGESQFQERDSFNFFDSGIEFNNNQELSSAGSDKPLTEFMSKQDMSVVNSDKPIQSTQVQMGASTSNAVMSQPVNETLNMFKSATQSLEIPVDIAHPEWADKFSDHIVWLGHQEIKSAFIKINPEELGPIEINIKLDKEAATLNIASHSAHVCEIVDQSLPRLKDMMAEQGISLTDVHIDTNRDAQQFFDRNQPEQDQKGELTDDENAFKTPIVRKKAEGLIDYFA